jgi:hypothetical protein
VMEGGVAKIREEEEIQEKRNREGPIENLW